MPETTIINVTMPSQQQTPQVQTNQTKVQDNGVNNLFSWIQINTEYFKNTPGFIKIIQAIIGIICICLASPARSVATQWFLFIVIISFIATVIWIFVYFLSVKEALNFPVNWPLSEMINFGLIAIMYVIVSVMQISAWVAAHYMQYRISNIVAGIFGLLNTVVYLFAAYLSYDEWKHTHTIK